MAVGMSGRRCRFGPIKMIAIPKSSNVQNVNGVFSIGYLVPLLTVLTVLNCF